MPVVRGINLAVLEELSESNSEELNNIVERNEQRLDDLHEQEITVKRRILAAEFKLRSKKAKRDAQAGTRMPRVPVEMNQVTRDQVTRASDPQGAQRVTQSAQRVLSKSSSTNKFRAGTLDEESDTSNSRRRGPEPSPSGGEQERLDEEKRIADLEAKLDAECRQRELQHRQGEADSRL